ncbi:hypothetical protein [Wolbachia endosymbiont (group A) of Bibio marci]|uniref:hypothetical protein n=1 Tax=Wolbachia endosymbiont (group A) of Bibio marci TaxID=2953987 RepID=UPI0022327C4D|nr:hypothetical protein [Wolbachia endosymbiont (group A) of Bibio marci]
MKNIFNKTNAPYLVAGTLATLALVSSGVVGVLIAVAVFNASLPLIAGLVGLAIFSAATIALSAVAINKNKTISEKDTQLAEKDIKISSLENQLAKKEKAIEAKNKIIVNPNKDHELKRREKEQKVLDYADLRSLFKEEKQGKVLDSVAIGNPNTKTEDGQYKEETKVNGYVNQAVGAVNWLVGQAKKITPVVAASYLPYVFYNYATTPVSASFDDVNVTQSFVATSPAL